MIKCDWNSWRETANNNISGTFVPTLHKRLRNRMNGRWCQNVIYRSEWEMHSLRLPFLESRQVLSDSNSLLENVLSKSSFLMLLTMKWLVYLMCGSYWSAAEWSCYWLCSFYIAPLKICHCQTFKINNCGEHGNSFVNISKLLWTVNCFKAHSSIIVVSVCVCVYIYIFTHIHTHIHIYIHILFSVWM
jgi:hypothetical protein